MNYMAVPGLKIIHVGIDKVIIDSIEKEFCTSYSDWMRRKELGARSYFRNNERVIPRMTMFYLLFKYRDCSMAKLARQYDYDRASLCNAVKSIVFTYLYDQDYGKMIYKIECDVRESLGKDFQFREDVKKENRKLLER